MFKKYFTIFSFLVDCSYNYDLDGSFYTRTRSSSTVSNRYDYLLHQLPRRLDRSAIVSSIIGRLTDSSIRSTVNTIKKHARYIERAFLLCESFFIMRELG